MIPRRQLGNCGVELGRFGLGGEGVLRTTGREAEAVRLIHRALDLGVDYFETARAYASSEQYLGAGLAGRRSRMFLATKSHHRDARGARAHLRESLAALRTDWIDLWFLHDVRTREDLDVAFGPGGAMEVFRAAREEGQVRFLGVSGHQDPDILLQALRLHPFDCVLLPVNPCEAAVGSFADAVLPEAQALGLGVIAMKTLCRGLLSRTPAWNGPGPYLRYALSTPGVSIVSVGCDDPGQLEENLLAVAAPELNPVERDGLEQAVFPFARELLYYRP